MSEFDPIGVIRTPFKEAEGMPVQPAGARGTAARAEVFEEYAGGLKDLDGFSHVFLLYHFHLSSGFDLEVVPFLDSSPRGLFSTRAPKRPNPIGLSVVRLEKIEGSVLHLLDADIIDGTPLLDIKPYVPEFDTPSETRTGWIEKAGQTSRKKLSDSRFK